MGIIVNRTVSPIESKDNRRFGKESLSIRDFETAHSYVLLSEPGMGKSTEFHKEAHRVHADPPIPAHQFISRKPEHHPEWRKGPLFIDGLDEIRVGRGGPREALGKIIDHLEALGKPPFRLSCRSIRWLEPGDRKRLATLSDSKDVPVLLLNPLSYKDIRKIISEPKAHVFIQQAHEHGMTSFLFSPQLLNLLLRSVEADGWTDRPSKTFKNACRTLVQEQNTEHHDAHASSQQPSNEAVLGAGGQLAALMLIANKAGWSIDDTEDSKILSLRDIETDDRSALDAAFRSGLLEGDLIRRTPIHRLLIEFLGARYLHQKIQSGLSIRRVFALLMGDDGAPFPDLRGLIAWLASFNPHIRETLIQTDPIAIAFNGDTSSFSLGERRELVKHLERHIDPRLIWPSMTALGALVGNQGSSLIWELTGLPDRSERRQTLVYQLLRGVSQRYSRVDVSKRLSTETQLGVRRKNLLNIVYDPSWQEPIRCEALRALNLIFVGQSNREIAIRELFSDLQRGLLSDEKNNLRGTILDLLYPEELSPQEIWNYLVNGTVAYQHNIYLEFWHHLIERSREDPIKELLNSLCDRASEVIPKLVNHRLSHIVPELLARGLNLFGDELDILDLSRWFKLVKSDIQGSQLVSIGFSGVANNRIDEASTSIRNWLNKRPEIQLALIKHELLTQESRIDSNLGIGLKFVGTNPPAGFRSWCLAHAKDLWDTHPIVAERLARWSVQVKKGWEDPLSDDKVEQIVSDIPGLHEWNCRRLIRRDQVEQEDEWRNQLTEIHVPVRERRQKELEAIRKQKSEIAKGTCLPNILHHLASIYFDGLAAKGEDPKSQLISYLEGDLSLVQATLAGFRSMLDRDDLPDLDQIVQLHETNKMSFFALPFLAGMEQENDRVIDRFSERRRRRVLGFYHVMDQPIVPAMPRGEDMVNLFVFHEEYRPSWYEKVLKHYPEIVADSLVAIHNACVRAKLPPSRYLYEMVDNPAYLRVAQLAVTRMFSVFPTRCNERQLESLRIVLWSATRERSMSIERLRQITLKRLHRKNMDIAQRAQWLCAGIYAARDHCLALLEEFLSAGQESRVHRVLRFLVPDGGRLILQNIQDWSPEDMLRLIRALGKRMKCPHSPDGAHRLSREELSRTKFESILTLCLKEFIKRSDSEAMEALDSLATDPDLATWKYEIMRAQEERNQNLRVAKRANLSLEQVQRALRDGPPASAADLAALTTDVLEKLADRIRNGPTNEWCQYWCRDSETNKFTEPQHENDCRDILLSHLNVMLNNYHVHGEPEGPYADEKRADIRLSYGSDLAIPIEIKRSQHPDIWRGISEQLVPKYVRDLQTDGYGIYLVFWFGTKYAKGGVPNDPQELKSLLEKQLDPALRKKIHVVVIDVSLGGRFAEQE